MNAIAHASSSFDVGRALTIAAIGGAVVAGGIMLAPHILPSIGIGAGEMAAESLGMLHEAGGIAGGVNKVLAAVPLVGSKLAEGGFFNAIATGIVGLGGVMLGDSIAQDENGAAAMRWGKFIKYGALITSALIALPTVLTAIGSGLIFLSTLTEDVTLSSNMVAWVNRTLGTMAGPDHPMLGLSGVAAALPHFITCGTSLLPAALSFKLWRDDRKEEEAADAAKRDMHGNPLPAEDRNNNLTKEEVALTHQYNESTPAQRILLKKHLLAKGYEPDFHADGTIHLYKHASSQAQTGARSI